MGGLWFETTRCARLLTMRPRVQTLHELLSWWPSLGPRVRGDERRECEMPCNKLRSFPRPAYAHRASFGGFAVRRSAEREGGKRESSLCTNFRVDGPSPPRSSEDERLIVLTPIYLKLFLRVRISANTCAAGFPAMPMPAATSGWSARRNELASFSSPMVTGMVGSPAAICCLACASRAASAELSGSTVRAKRILARVYSWPQ